MTAFSALRDSWYFFSRHLPAIALLSLPLITLEALLEAFIEAHTAKAEPSLYSLLANLLFYPLYSAALILFLDARSRGEHPHTLALWSGALRLWPRFALLTGLNVLLFMLGFAAYVLPGVWLMVKLGFSEYLLTLRGHSPLTAIRDSFLLSRGHFWTIALCIALALAPVWALDWLFGLWLGDDPAPLLAVLTTVISGFFQLFSGVVLFRLFMQLERPPAPPH
ncbi:hypothetical protein [Pseudomonas sp. RIT-PI-AD]|uniref:hypothetical protein n=1 Tax=Pseudomonas sp. RIT-PI-AD TaxID=3035294 RepID=UPI0021D84581|nr:hypothetical protein [Pseudomonas sp. RIT-PI-AD]